MVAFLTLQRKPVDSLDWIRWVFLLAFTPALIRYLLNAVYIVGGAAASYRRYVFRKLGGFDETIITEDIELSTRIQDHGWAVRYAPKAVIWTEGAPTFLGLAKQRVRWKYGRLVTFWRYRHLFFSLDRRHSRILSPLVLPA